MKRKLIVLSFILSFLAFISNEMQAQNDAYFNVVNEYRSPDATGFSFDNFSGQSGQGFYFDQFSGNSGQGFNFEGFINQQNGFTFEEFTSGEVPVGNGLFVLTTAGFIYLINIRRKENKK